MTEIKTQRRYWAYEDLTLDLEEILRETEDEDASRVAPYLSDVSAKYDETGGLDIRFASPDGVRFLADVYAIDANPFDDFDEDEDEEPEEEDGGEEVVEVDEEEEEFDDAPYSWMVEIAREGEPALVDYEGVYHQPPSGEPIRFQDMMPVLAAIAEAVYAESDQDHGSPHSVVGDRLF